MGCPIPPGPAINPSADGVKCKRLNQDACCVPGTGMQRAFFVYYMAVRRFYRGPQRLDIRRLAAYDPGSLWIRADTNDPYPFRVQCSAIGGSLPAAGSAAYKPKQSRVFQLDQDSKNPHSDASKCGFPYLLLCSPLLRRRHSPWFLACFLIVCPRRGYNHFLWSNEQSAFCYCGTLKHTLY